ncbi:MULTISPECIES: (2Fe-2S)-binding protein [Paenibacillus]|uniref:Ferric siderophore reductase C-terminal domain-containing protein n=1 Tax=Paenibacillus borealis TaxID=160799 RepID=A0ABX3H4Q1_PAEBO|nr:(2Fe-2S)-binding protein [Paenibacillus borealis]OMD45401.1 hypothetical protein BSK56_19975 [Paenibacillus borealis]
MDFKQLEDKYFLTLHEPCNTILAMSAYDLLQAGHTLLLLDTYGPYIKSGERSTTAVFFCTWLGELCAAMQHMLFCGEETILELSLRNISVQLYDADTQYPLFSFKINEIRRIEIPTVDREAWSTKVLHSFYNDLVRPLIEILSAVAQINVMQLWGQITNTLYSRMEEELAGASSMESRLQISNHYNILKQGIDPKAFGLRSNPFDVKLRYIEDPAQSKQRLLLKTACCLAYRLDTGFGYCDTCPRLNAKDRAARFPS